MTFDRTRPLLCFVHSIAALEPALRLIERAAGGWDAADIVQVRGKGLPAGELEELVERWIRVLPGATALVVHDRVDVAIATGAAGVHVGRGDLAPEAIRALAPGLAVGVSAHDRAELEAAAASGAAYAGLGAFYASRTKPDARRLDPARAGLREPIPGLSIPVLAIGGITAERVGEVLAIPAVTGVAVSEAVQGAEHPAEALARLRSSLDAAWAVRPAASLPEAGRTARRAG
jgi:thiamine-phosphate pyrophosphorylase